MESNNMEKIDIFRAIPDYSAQRELKIGGYTDHPIDETDPRYDEELVPISEYGIIGKSYYSQPNRVTGEPVPGVSPDIYVRMSVADKLKAINQYLRADERVSDVLGGATQLHVRDGLRSLDLQRYLRDEFMPQHVRNMHPEWSEGQIQEESARKIAPGNPSAPHPSGGVVDLNLVYTDSGENVFNGQGKDIANNAVNPDYLETVYQNLGKEGFELPEALEVLSAEKFQRALLARRVLFNLMKDDTIGGVSMVVNPVETWHYGDGDRLSALVKSYEQGELVMAHFGPASDPGIKRSQS